MVMPHSAAAGAVSAESPTKQKNSSRPHIEPPTATMTTLKLKPQHHRRSDSSIAAVRVITAAESSVIRILKQGMILSTDLFEDSRDGEGKLPPFVDYADPGNIRVPVFQAVEPIAGTAYGLRLPRYIFARGRRESWLVCICRTQVTETTAKLFINDIMYMQQKYPSQRVAGWLITIKKPTGNVRRIIAGTKSCLITTKAAATEREASARASTHWSRQE